MKYLFSLICLLIFSRTHGQSTEFVLRLNSGLYSYRGMSSESTTFLNTSRNQDGSISNNDLSGITYANNPFGKKSAISYGFGFQVQHITKSTFLIGGEIAFESVASKVNVDGVSGSGWQVSASGKAILRATTINIHPFVGKRFNFNSRIHSDLTVGVDLALISNLEEKGTTKTSDGVEFNSLLNRSNEHSVDVRPRFDLTTYVGQYGLAVGYSSGIPNYTSNLIGGKNGAYSKMIRIGLVYRLK